MVFYLFMPAQYETNPLKIVVNSGLHLYQRYISPGQGDVCNFSPSCSHFAKKAISRNGPLWGALMAADRLMRCNPWAHRYFDIYYRDIKNHKLCDPVANNFIFKDIKKHDTTKMHRVIDTINID